MTCILSAAHVIVINNLFYILKLRISPTSVIVIGFNLGYRTYTAKTGEYSLPTKVKLTVQPNFAIIQQINLVKTYFLE